jgi:hypothetical protein
MLPVDVGQPVNTHRKLIISVAATVVLIVLLVISIIVIGPKLIAGQAIQDTIRNELSERFGAALTFERLAISFVPAPRIDVYQTMFKSPAGLEGTLEEVTVYPKILPLLIGEISLKALLIQRPALAITLERVREPEPLRATVSAIGALFQRLVATPDVLPAIGQSRIDDGYLELLDTNGRRFALGDVNASLSNVAGKAQFEATAASAVTESLSLTGWIDKHQQRSHVQIRVTQAQLPRMMNDFLASDAPVRITEGAAELGLDLVANGAGQMRADIDVDAPWVKLAQASEDVAIKGGTLRAGVAVHDKSVVVSVSELTADRPKLRISGTLTSALGGGRMRLALQGGDIDVREVRQAALVLAKHSQISRRLFGVLKTGLLASIALRTDGQTLGDLEKLDNLLVQGKLREAGLTIPDTQLEVTDTSVDFALSNGGLEGHNLQARLGNSSVREGQLTLDLAGADKPFKLKALVRADLSELPPLLTRVMPASIFEKRVAPLGSISGKASGNLVLNKDAGTEKFKVEASELALTADASRMPFPLRIAGGSIRYEENRLGFTDVTGSLGRSPFSALTGVLRLQEKPELEIASGKGRFYLDEIVPWVRGRHWIPEALKYYGGGAGTITVSSVHLQGLVDSPQAARFSVSGQVKDLVLENLPEHPGLLTIRSANFQANPDTLHYRDARLSLLDAEITLAATHHRYFDGLDQDVALAVEGHLGPQAIQWASGVLGAPLWLRPQPLRLSSSELTYRKNGLQAFSVALRLDDGVEVSIMLNRSPGKLVINKVSIRDEVSQATIGLHWKPKNIDVSFSGKLHRQTIDRLLVENRLLDGWINGDLRASIPTPTVANSRVIGNLRGRGVLGNWNSRLPFSINGFVISGKAHRLFVDWADLTLAQMQLRLSGKIELPSQEPPQLDMTVRADHLDLDEIVQVLRAMAATTGGPADKTFARLPVRGKVQLKTDGFVLNDFTWAPLRANIRIDRDAINIMLRDAVLCGISTPGTLSLSPDSVQFNLKLLAEDQALGNALSCVVGELFKADGTYTLQGQVQGQGNAESLLKNASGTVELTANDGRIYHDIVLLKVLKFLNASEFFTGRANLEDVGTKGFHYRLAKLSATLQKGTLRYRQGILDANPMAVVASGEHNLFNGRLRIDLLVAPLVPLDRVLEDVPVVGGILDTLDTLPLTATGRYDDLTVRPLAPSAVDYQLQELLRNILKVPIRLIGGREARQTKR